MINSYGMDAYRAHDLNISMKTSSGDVIKMDFSNHQSISMSYEQDASGTKTSTNFSSMQSFQFSIDSNGIDAQDKKEIDAFMKTAQPFIDNFLKELEDVAPKSPVSQLAHQIAGIFEPTKDRDENGKNFVKSNIVKMFDNSMNKLTLPKDDESALEKMFADVEKLLEKTLKEFDNFYKDLYA